MKNDNDDKIKLAIAGFSKTGKSKLMEYLKNGFEKLNFQETSLPAVGIDIIGSKLFLYKKKIYKLEFWETSSQLLYSALVEAFLKTVHINFIFFNYNERSSFDQAKSLLNTRKTEKQVYILIGSKYDIKINTNKKNNIVHEEEALELAKEKNALFAHLSLLNKYSNGVNELFRKALDEYIKRTELN